MNFLKKTVAALCGAAATLIAASPAFGQASRTWVSGVGDDANPCSRTAPCKTFAGAISKTADGGEINVLDPGGFGAVTITKNISIIADGDLGGIAAGIGSNGIIVNAPGAKVLIQGLDIDGAGGLNGIRLIAGDVHVEDCLIRGFTANANSAGIAMEATNPSSRLYVSNSSIYYNSIGVRITQQGATAAGAIIEHSRIDRNLVGVSVDGGSSAVYLTGNTLLGQSPDIQGLNGGQIISFGDNAIFNGTPNGTLQLK